MNDSTEVRSVILAGVLLLAMQPAIGAERDAEAARKAAQGESPEVAKAGTESQLPDLTKGELIGEDQHGENGPITWNIGATGIIGNQERWIYGDADPGGRWFAKGSPADGIVLMGDVILGADGKDFEPGGHLGVALGNAIIKAEEPAQKGVLKLHLWRDKNWAKRFGEKDMYALNLEEVFRKAEEDITLYDWQPEEKKESRALKEAYDEYPMEPEELNVELKLAVIGTYSDTSPYDCDVAKTIRENALKVIAARVGKKSSRGRMQGSWPDVLALVASGKPAYIEQAKAWVRTQKLETDMNREMTLKDLKGGKQTWYHGFNSLEMAIYYDATKDPIVLPEIRKRALMVAMGQNGGGTWGHGFSLPGFNGGMLHKSNPGYGAMNNPGTRCFFLMALAKKHGVDHFELDDAIERSRQFFATFVDKGAIPYGYHPPWPSDASNGKNYGAAYAHYVLGEKYNGKYFSLNSAHAAFSRRGGHGSPTLWYYTPLSAVINGPPAIQASMRNMRWFYTLARRHDGSFVFQGEQVGIGGKGMRVPTATHALYYSTPLEQLIITGKDMDKKFWMTDEELDELMMSTREQCADPALLGRHGTPWVKRETSELLDYLDHFYTKRRITLADELARRYHAGEKGIKDEVIKRLADSEARMREGACLTLAAMGRDEVLGSLSKVIALLEDDAEFVRATAVKTIGGASDTGDKTRETELLKAMTDQYSGLTKDNGNFHTAIRNVLFPSKRPRGAPKSIIESDPFNAGYDPDLVGHALEEIVTMDPGGVVPGGWNRETVLRLAGPITFSAEEYQLNDAMFAGSRMRMAHDALRKHGFREAAESDAGNLRKRTELNRLTRRGITFKAPYLTPSKVLEDPGRYKSQLDHMYVMLLDDPVDEYTEKVPMGEKNGILRTPLTQMITVVEKAADPGEPSIGDEVGKRFRAELKEAGGTGDQLKLCRKELSDLSRKTFFRKRHAMTTMAELLGVDSMEEIARYLGHEQWRLRDHAHAIAVDLVKQGGGAQLIAAYEESQGREVDVIGNFHAAAVLDALSAAKHKPALEVARGAMTHKDPRIRRSAVQALFAIGGDAELKSVLKFMVKATHAHDLEGCEKAFLSRKDDAAHVARLSGAVVKILPKVSLPVRRSMAFVIGQFGGAENLAAIRTAILAAEKEDDLRAMVHAMAYSPDRAADQIMLDLLSEKKEIVDMVAAYSVHRMVGHRGMSSVEDAQRLKIAKAVLAERYDPKVIKYLGKVHKPQSVSMLFDVMKSGKVDQELIVDTLLYCAEGYYKPTQKESDLVREVLSNVIEYIEVTQLRGGAAAHVKGAPSTADEYAMWKGIQARAGSAMLKFHKPKESKIPTFGGDDLDI